MFVKNASLNMKSTVSPSTTFTSLRLSWVLRARSASISGLLMKSMYVQRTSSEVTGVPSLKRARGLMCARIHRPLGSICQPSASAPTMRSVFGSKLLRLWQTRSRTRVE